MNQNNLPSHNEDGKIPHKYPLNKPLKTTEVVVQVDKQNLPTYQEALLM